MFEYGSKAKSFFDPEEYSNFFPKMEINPEFQYLEVGSGIGGFIPHVIRHQTSNSPRPIVIDPADYSLMEDMLNYALRLGGISGFKRRLRLLADRVSIFRDPKKVRLVNLKLSEALKVNPNLEGIADVAVDNWGAVNYLKKGMTMKLDITNLEIRLLKNTGKLITGNGVGNISVINKSEVYVPPRVSQSIHS